jgi:hypothetical protein
VSSRTHSTRAKNFLLREPANEHRLLVSNLDSNRKEFWCNNTFHNQEFKLRRISDDRGGTARWSNTATFGHFIQYTFAEITMRCDLIKEIVSVYQKHGWQLRRLLLRPESRASLEDETSYLNGVEMEEATIDALWFSRASHGQREAWELRLVAENPYALFETFEADESDEERDDVRREMEARMREYLKKSDE